MSGTSADGINVALVDFPERRSGAANRRKTTNRAKDLELPKFQLVSHWECPYPSAVRRMILQLMNAKAASVADLAQLNFLLGELYAEAVLAAQQKSRLRVDLVGCHGQTIYHQGSLRRFLGKAQCVTWQTGEGAVIAARVGVPVVSDFRPADMAAGGKGAPLVPYFDYIAYGDAGTGRIAQNIGGIANLTAIPAGARVRQVIAFDTGPGNMVIDAVTESLFGRSFDRDGKIAASGNVLTVVVRQLLRAPFFRSRPPKTAGREEFGSEFAAQFLHMCAGSRKEDVVATATALTAGSIADALRRFVLPRNKSYQELVVSGGGGRNPTLVRMLATEIEPLGVRLRLSDEFGIPGEAKEAVAFAVLAFETWNRRPSNIPSATGAKRPAILGKISYA